ncbi:structural protein [Pectobacterium phage vB_PcaM_CBB]|uniref:Structural protein n=1 Tax=Pectobacterium phage vB_PcaM_CBB TaxID=2772511 RepID=A0A1L2CUL8_9CAUD|nr:structural protein [Pectobacterium phage vB_PcaM_CBB]AMM43714.1 structural protein [Pectobacterium phage vB_PcaM_CBB]
MSKKIIGDMSVQRNAQSNGRNTIRDVNNIAADVNGNINLPYYNKEYINKVMSTIPLSRIGTMDYLPMNINGSFEGSSNYIGKGVYPILLENDGTLVYLRPGTNGSTFGYYYCYVSNARTVLNLAPVVTNEKFTPTNFTSSHTLDSFISTDASELLMMRTNDGTNDTYTLSLTNGTMNSVAHQNLEFPASTITGTDPQYAMVVDNLIYIFCLDGYSNTSEMAISVYTLPKNNIISGTFTALTKVTGFSGVNLFGTSISASPNIKLAPMYFSNTPSDNSLYCVPTGNVYRGFSSFWGNNEGTLHAERNDRLIRIAFVHAAEATTQQSNTRSLSAISLVLDTSNKKYTLDNTNTGQVTITTNPTTGAITWNNPYSANMENYSGLSVNGSLNRVPTYATTSDGVQFTSTARHDSSPEHYISRCKINNFVSRYNAWNVTTRSVNSMLLNIVNPVFGSVIGENLIHPTIISSSKILMHCSGTYNNNITDYNTNVYTTLSGNPDYVYKSVSTGGTINGFKPSEERVILNNPDYRYTGCVTIMNQDGSTKVYGSSFVQDINKFSALEMNQNDFSYSQQITMNNTLLNNLKQDVMDSVTLPYPVLQSYIVLYYVPDNSYSKSYAVVTMLFDAPTGTANSYHILSEVDVTLSSNSVTAYNILSSYLINRNIVARSINTGLIERMGGMIIAKYQEFTYVGIPTLFAVNTSAGNFSSLICKVDNSTKMIKSTPKMISTAYNSSTANSYQVGVIPKLGFGLFENGAITDIKTKLVFKNYGTTEAQFDAMVANPASNPLSRIVIAAQDVAEGFIIYFTQRVPAFIQGNYFEMPITSINLNDITSNPSNKTFYLYITIVEGEAVYQISESLLSEELYRVYIGTIVTGQSAITSISTEKVTRFLNYRTSTTKRGSAIPTSTGVPSGTGTRWH